MIKKYTFIIIFLIYWFLTILFTIPENYIQIKLGGYKDIFSTFFYQKWSFFAPPPKSNDRLYYEFIGYNDTLVVEVLAPIDSVKRSKFPMNDNESIIDYIISSSLINISEKMRKEYQIYEYESCDNIASDICLEKFYKIFSNNMNNTIELRTLKNYGLIVHEKLSKKYHEFRIIYATIPIKKFSPTSPKKRTYEEKIIFISNYQKIILQ